MSSYSEAFPLANGVELGSDMGSYDLPPGIVTVTGFLDVFLSAAVCLRSEDDILLSYRS